MTREEKNLLLKDLCSRLPYLIKVGTTDNDGSLENLWDIHLYNTFTEDVNLIHFTENASRLVDISEIRPYLFPLSSMTEEQKEEHKVLLDNQYSFDTNSNVFTLQDFYCKYHLDFRELISKGLAIDATGLNIY